jgi:inosose dehydratase
MNSYHNSCPRKFKIIIFGYYINYLKMSSRRNFIKISGLGVAGAATAKIELSPKKSGPRKKSSSIPFELGIASYTFRKFSLEETLSMTKRLNIKNIAFKDFHLPLTATDETIKKTVSMVQQAGLNLYGGGVIYMNTETEVNGAFEYAKKAEMKIIIGAPAYELLPLINRKVNEYDIALAIHNHGPNDKLYPSLESIIEKIADLDPRIGICHDIGHTQRFGGDPVKDTEKYFNRILDLHIKDVTAASAEGNTCEMGRGIIDLPGVFTVLIKNSYHGKASFEYEKDENDPLPGLAESVGYVRGLLKML